MTMAKYMGFISPIVAALEPHFRHQAGRFWRPRQNLRHGSAQEHDMRIQRVPHVWDSESSALLA
jgi:hypothetical protein